MSKRDYYEILGIQKTASAEEIKKAYRKKSMETHPDRGGNEDEFKEIAEAYEILSDQAKKQNYDAYGHAGPTRQSATNNPFDIFSQFFRNSGFNPFEEQAQGNRNVKGQDLNVTVKLTLEEILNGATKKFRYKRKTQCTQCESSGGKDKKICSNCRGSGMIGQVINTPFGQIRNTTSCNVCQGLGSTYETICDTCKGAGVLDMEETIDVNIPHGVNDGMRMMMEGKGNAVRHGITPGDLIIMVMELPHDTFVRVGNELKYVLKLTYPQMVLGDKVEIPTIGGTKIRININEFTKVGEILRIQSKGLKQFGSENRGDMLITVELKMPTQISDEEKSLIIDLKNLNEKVATQ
jgi:molecular chaperone DnaJ